VTPTTMATFESSDEPASRPRLPFDAQRIHHGPQLLAIHAGHLRGQNFRALDVANAALEARNFGARELLLHLFDLAFQRAFLFGQLFLSLPRCARFFLLNFSQDRFARDGFDAAHAGRNAAFVSDDAQADVAGAMDVRAAAQLLAETVGSETTRTRSPYFSPNSAMAPVLSA
jgi:hypothetical protein